MALPGRKIFDFNTIDELSRGDTWVHTLDARVKIIVTFIFLFLALSLSRYEISNLLPFFLFPLVIMRQADLPFSFILGRALVVLPFVFLIGIFNPVFDTTPMVHVGGFTLSAGWVSFFSLILRGYLTALAALVLVSSTGFFTICSALRQMKVPAILTTQLILLYRSLFILTDEASRMITAWKLKSFGKQLRLKTWSSLTGHLLLRSIDRSERMHQGLLSRHFGGEIMSLPASRWRVREYFYVVGWSLFFLFLRYCSPSLVAGKYIQSILS